MRKVIVWLLMISLLTSCLAPRQQEDEILLSDEEEQQEVSIVPSHRLSDENYKIILPYRPSEARGVIVGQVANRFDIDELEDGLRRHSKEYFSPKDYYFEEGQYLSRDTVYKWLGRKLTKDQLKSERDAIIKQRERDQLTVNDEVIERIERDLQLGLNPALKDLDGLKTKEKKELYEENPQYISHILEQNFLKRVDENTVELVGMSIGLSMKSVYQYQTEIGGPYYYKDISKEEMLEKGKEMAEKIVKRLRDMEELQNIPIMLMIFRESEPSSPVSGNFVTKTFVNKDSSSIDEWETIDEEYVLFPSSSGKEKYYDEHELITSFGHKISDYFPNYTGVIGEGFYIGGELQKMKVKIPLEFHGSGEILGFTQYIYGIAQEIFSTNYDLEIRVESSEQLESLIFRERNEEDLNVHIVH
ncbi:MAG TPA: CamS family sex pheromone protein [Bacillota bacterium]|nr:CamS family sex pheromone protein [Bacillota bacterium]